MDPTKQRRVEQKRKLYPGKHYITYTISVNKLLVLKSWPFEKTYNTECKCLPTSWNLKFEFLEVREDATASLSLALKRCDSQNVGLEAYFWIFICDQQENHIFPKQIFHRDSIMPGDEFRETLEISSHPDRTEAVDGKIVVHFSVLISSCHEETD